MGKTEKNRGRSSRRSRKQQDFDALKGKGDGSEPPAFLRFSGVAFEMLATIGVGTYGGYLLDEYLEFSFPVFLLSLSMVSLFISLYLLYKRLPKE